MDNVLSAASSLSASLYVVVVLPAAPYLDSYKGHNNTLSYQHSPCFGQILPRATRNSSSRVNLQNARRYAIIQSRLELAQGSQCC